MARLHRGYERPLNSRVVLACLGLIASFMMAAAMLVWRNGPTCSPAAASGAACAACSAQQCPPCRDVGASTSSSSRSGGTSSSRTSSNSPQELAEGTGGTSVGAELLCGGAGAVPSVGAALNDSTAALWRGLEEDFEQYAKRGGFSLEDVEATAEYLGALQKHKDIHAWLEVGWLAAGAGCRCWLPVMADG